MTEAVGRDSTEVSHVKDGLVDLAAGTCGKLI